MLIHGSSSSSKPAARKNVASIRYNKQSLKESSLILDCSGCNEGSEDAMEEDESDADFHSFRSDTPTSTYTSNSANNSPLLTSSGGNGAAADSVFTAAAAATDATLGDDNNDSIWSSLFSNDDGDSMMAGSEDSSSCSSSDEEGSSRAGRSKKKRAVSQFAAVPSTKNRCTSFAFPR